MQTRNSLRKIEVDMITWPISETFRLLYRTPCYMITVSTLFVVGKLLFTFCNCPINIQASMLHKMHIHFLSNNLHINEENPSHECALDITSTSCPCVGSLQFYAWFSLLIKQRMVYPGASNFKHSSFHTTCNSQGEIRGIGLRTCSNLLRFSFVSCPQMVNRS